MISSIVLAAGKSSRMGTPKALLDWGGEILVAFQVRQLREAGADEVIVVLGDRSDDIQRKMGGVDCRVMFNPMHFQGRAGSLRIGARAVSRDADAIVIINVDQPRPADLIRSLIEAHGDDGVITRPSHNGRHGHPIVVAGSLRDELLQVDEQTEGLRAVVHGHQSQVRELPTDDLPILDINTPEDYAEALRRFGLAD